MRIALSPIVTDAALALSVIGDAITLNGDELDLSVLAEGDEIADEQARSLHPMIAGPILRQDGDIHLTLWLPLPLTCSDPWMTHPDVVEVAGDGLVDLPFATFTEVTEAPAEGGRNVTTTIHRWHQAPEAHTVFVPDPPAQEEEPA